jgi:hypothetical protein
LHDLAAPQERIHVTEPQARRLVLAQALEAGDPQGRLVGAIEREQVEREALAVSGDPARGEPLDERAYLLARADRLVELLSHRQPSLTRLAQPPAWQTWLAWALPLVALVAGALIDRIDNPRQVNLLSPPLLAFLFWNLAVYVMLVVFALRRPRAGSQAPSAWMRMAQGLAGRAGAGLRGQVSARFQLAWWRVGGALEGQRWRRILHLSAAAWGVGVALSIVLGGLVREYRIGWESTLLDLPQVHAFLSALFAPVVAVTPLQPFGVDELARLHFGSGADVGRMEARRWVFMYLALIGLLVVLPRLLLAAFAWWRGAWMARSLAVDLGHESFAPVLGRVRPARVTLLLVEASESASGVAEQALRQAGAVPPPDDPRETWTVLATPRGDALQCRAQAGDAKPGAPTGTSFWSRWLVRAEPAERRATADLVLLTADMPLHERALAACRETGLPVLWLLGQGSEAEAGAALRRAGLAGEVLPAQALPTWREDARLRSAIARQLPPYKAPGMERLSDQWQRRAQERLTESMRLLASELLLAARETHQLAAEPVGVRQLVVRGEREAQQEARRDAGAAILARLRERQAAGDARLLALHALDGVLPESGWQPVLPQRLQVLQAVHEPQAGLAGAASGAAMGAAVDLMTGGLTLGAAAALGALVGGGAGLVGAALKNRRTEPGLTSVALGDEMMLALVQSALVRYLAAVHERRAAADTPRWAASAEAALAAQAPSLRELWIAARAHPDGPAEVKLTEHLQRLALQLLEELNGPV